ncbi:hypothetical protein [Paenarthrobacter sp. YJN-D]|uniref:hypothetical protein n=1 Tax=Paenarthrobacter sp. YJN-D TaxID=2735317 RepID=UPI0018776221|nr:hypothetical protein [Paenarthrobacter sp. YJN-D]QOT22727.1 hypothetical protein HMI60_14955 [Paenarthrobacter sp. YJN-D]
MQDRWIATAISARSGDLGALRRSRRAPATACSGDGVRLVSVGPVVIEVQLDGHGHQKNLTLGTSCIPASKSREPCKIAG